VARDASPRRRVVHWHLPGLVADIVGYPDLYGLAAFCERRSDVAEELLVRGLAITVAHEHCPIGGEEP